MTSPKKSVAVKLVITRYDVYFCLFRKESETIVINVVNDPEEFPRLIRGETYQESLFGSSAKFLVKDVNVEYHDGLMMGTPPKIEYTYHLSEVTSGISFDDIVDFVLRCLQQK